MFRDPQSPNGNLAMARMGRWSAAHWKTATFGWLAFVVVAFALGGVVGTKQVDQNTPGPGESGRMERILDDGLQAARRRERPDPEPLAARRRPRLHGRDRDVVARVSKVAAVQNVHRGARSRRTGTPRWSSSTSAATGTRRSTRSARSSTASPPRSAPIRASSSASSVLASAQKGVDTAYGDDLGKAGMLSLPITLIILVLTFGALVAAGIPLLLGADRRRSRRSG